MKDDKMEPNTYTKAEQIALKLFAMQAEELQNPQGSLILSMAGLAPHPGVTNERLLRTHASEISVLEEKLNNHLNKLPHAALNMCGNLLQATRTGMDTSQADMIAQEDGHKIQQKRVMDTMISMQKNKILSTDLLELKAQLALLNMHMQGIVERGKEKFSTLRKVATHISRMLEESAKMQADNLKTDMQTKDRHLEQAKLKVLQEESNTTKRKHKQSSDDMEAEIPEKPFQQPLLQTPHTTAPACQLNHPKHIRIISDKIMTKLSAAKQQSQLQRRQRRQPQRQQQHPLLPWQR